MSTYIHLACLDHSPFLFAEDESQQHAADWQIAHIRDVVTRRRELLAVDRDIFDVDDRYDRNTLRFLSNHPSCRVAARTEYGDWIDMGMGVPAADPDAFEAACRRIVGES